ncbi:MAG TPA: hypothetical protein VK470_08165 [Bacteroidota bacterium]|nr:hypothetical protein [Bacteroidota bacterium]
MTHSTHHIIPENEQYCIWMDAGVVDYKLCNLQFKCDECAFDAQRRREHTSAGTTAAGAETSASADDACAQTLEQMLRAIELTPLPSDRVYSMSHAWAKVADDPTSGSYLVGIDHFMGTMLASSHSVACSMPGTHVRAGEPYAWIVANGETLALHSPLSGTVSAANHALADRTTVLHSDPYGNGWIAKIMPDTEQRRNALQPAAEFASVLARDAYRFGKMIGAKFHEMRPISGATMYDGGTLQRGFEDMLGTKTYYGILEHFLRSSHEGNR